MSKQKRLTVRLPDDLAERLSQVCQLYGLTMAGAVVMALMEKAHTEGVRVLRQPTGELNSQGAGSR